MRIFSIMLFLLSLLLFPQAVQAATSCQSIYGGQNCTTTTISLEKDVVNPQTRTEVHDLGTTDFNFQPGQTITFHIKITNNGSAIIPTATVTDNFPEFVNFASGPGTFDTNNRTLTWTVSNLGPNQTQIFTVEGTIFTTPDLPPLDQNCDINQATVTTDDNQMAQDSSQFCISHNTTTPAPTIQPNITSFPASSPSVPLTTTPVTGASGIMLLALLPVGIGGYIVQHFARRRFEDE